VRLEGLDNLVRKSSVVFKISYMCDYITKLGRSLAKVFLNHVNPDASGTGQGEAMHRKYKGVNLIWGVGG
jgi:hypothetical protein